MQILHGPKGLNISWPFRPRVDGSIPNALSRPVLVAMAFQGFQNHGPVRIPQSRYCRNGMSVGTPWLSDCFSRDSKQILLAQIGDSYLIARARNDQTAR